MIDISHKRSSLRYAKASGRLFAEAPILEMIKDKKIPKGDVGQMARSAGIQAAKRTSDWIVFCHSLPLDWVDIFMEFEPEAVRFTAEVRTVWKTGVEMEAMTAVSAALLNAYDMLKPLQTDISLGDIRLVEKRGGKSDMTDEFDQPVRVALLTIDTEKKSGRRTDRAAEVIRNFLVKQPVEIVTEEKLNEEAKEAERHIIRLTDQEQAELIFLCGSTGPTANDITPGLIRNLSDREVPGIGEAMRQYGLQRTPHAMISGQTAGIRNRSLMIAIPGSARGAEESLHALFPGILHIFNILRRS
ncbi:MAG: bifunctional molybdenum cofactor biosynthesis protein MoaC/MoaB [Balneolales bacterium]